MKFVKTAALVVACVALPAAAVRAQEMDTSEERGAYGTLGYAAYDWEADLGAIEGRLGYRLNRWFGLEAEAGFGVKKDTHRYVGLTQVVQHYELEYKFGAYAVAFLPLGEKTDLLARIGYGTTKVDLDGSYIGHNKAESWGFGVGAQHHFDGVNGLRLDYTRQERDSAAENGHADVWSVAYTRRF